MTAPYGVRVYRTDCLLNHPMWASAVTDPDHRSLWGTFRMLRPRHGQLKYAGLAALRVETARVRTWADPAEAEAFAGRLRERHEAEGRAGYVFAVEAYEAQGRRTA